VLRRTFGLKEEEVALSWRILHNKDPYRLVRYTKYYANEVMKDEMGGACNMYMRNLHKRLVEKPEGKCTWKT
jgi:hypothetical protein